MNICMIGHGMMGVAHTEALRSADCILHTVVGRRPEPTQAFAEQYGYRHWFLDVEQAVNQPEIDIVIITNPSALHAETALAALAAGKHTLVEIPITMNLADAERVVQTAEGNGLTLGVVHPLRMRPELRALRESNQRGEERIRHVAGRFFLRRLENVGSTGYRRSWTDNLLWHHMAHLCDFGLWLLETPIRQLASFMSPLDSGTGSQMDVCFLAETDREQSFVCTGSYYSQESIFELFVVSDAMSYRWDIQHKQFWVGKDAQPPSHKMSENGRIACDFVDAVRAGRPPVVPGASVLPALALLQQVQDAWDARWGRQPIAGRPTNEGK
jgi:2-hydroxy-4-carboxymuconate semialdehyde hemiacetal dehydrogenase